jgi:hypothetical protein
LQNTNGAIHPVADIVWVTLIGQIALPIGIIAWIGAGRARTALELGLKLLAAAACGGLLLVAGVWLLIPQTVLWGYAAAAGTAVWVAWRRLRHGPPRRPAGAAARWWRLGSHAAVGAACLAATAVSLAGYAPPSGLEVVGLSSPFRGGAFYAVNGGYSILINPHMKALGRPGLADYRGQSYAVDWVKVDGWGRRASGVFPDALEDYFIFGEPVYAPCSGPVKRIETALPDHRPGGPDDEPPAGNFVLLECGGAQVLLAHLMAGSVAVDPGETVQAGQPLGRVGNSGRSIEPHLHVHAQAPSAAGSFDTEPLPVSVDGRVPVRGSRLQPPGGESTP